VKNLSKAGKISSECEIANISPFGVWLLFGSKEYFLDHKKYPWFKKASVDDVLNVQSPKEGHLRWPTLDIDLHVDSLEHPERYPLISRLTHKKIDQTSQRRRRSA